MENETKVETDKAWGSSEEAASWSSGGMMRRVRSTLGNMKPDSEHLKWAEEEVGFHVHSQVLYYFK